MRDDETQGTGDLTEEERRRRCEAVARLCGKYAGKLSGSEEFLEEKHREKGA